MPALRNANFDVFDGLMAVYIDANNLFGKEFEAFRRRIESKLRNPVEIWSLYVIGCREVPDVVKIGITRNIEKRFKSLQTSNFYELQILRLIKAGSAESAFHAETVLHRHFKPFSLSGEWFRLSSENLQRLIQGPIYPFHPENPFEQPNDEQVERWVERFLSEGPKIFSPPRIRRWNA